MTPRKLERRVAAVRPKRSFLIFSEGEETEPVYITRWHQMNRRNITVEIPEFYGAPFTIVSEAAKRKRQAMKDERRQRGVAYDEVWCVFDVDEHPRLNEALQMARDNGINVALSNPCVELWFTLHFQNQQAFIDRHVVQGVAEGHLSCKKVLTPTALDELVARYSDAKTRAQALEQMHIGNGSPANENPSTGMWQLVDQLRP